MLLIMIIVVFKRKDDDSNKNNNEDNNESNSNSCGEGSFLACDLRFPNSLFQIHPSSPDRVNGNR